MPYPPGLAALGLPPERLVMVRAYKSAQGLWAMEEGLRCRARAVGDDGRIADWDVEWDDETRGLRLAAPAGDRAAAPQRQRATG